MNIQILIEDSLRAGLQNQAHRFAFEYEDTVSSSDSEAAERAWRITNGAINRLTGEDLELRLKWEAQHVGNVLSTGDVVMVDGRAYSCTPSGWRRTVIRDHKTNLWLATPTVTE